jgi:hypothetical protein
MTVSTRRRLPTSQGGGRCRERRCPRGGASSHPPWPAAARPAVGCRNCGRPASNHPLRPTAPHQRPDPRGSLAPGGRPRSPRASTPEDGPAARGRFAWRPRRGPGGQLPQPPAPARRGRTGRSARPRYRPARRLGRSRPGPAGAVEAVLDGPQVGRLAEEGGAVHPAQGREPVGPVAAEVLVQAAVGVDAEKLADAFDGQDLAVGQGGRRAAPAQGTGLTGPPVSRSYG